MRYHVVQSINNPTQMSLPNVDDYELGDIITIDNSEYTLTLNKKGKRYWLLISHDIVNDVYISEGSEEFDEFYSAIVNELKILNKDVTKTKLNLLAIEMYKALYGKIKDVFSIE